MPFNAPQSRNEAILQNMLGANNTLGEPESRIEELLMELLEAWENLDPSGGIVVEEVTGATPTIEAADNTIYVCGELTSLTISSIPQSGTFVVKFNSGATPTTFTEPTGMKMPDGFTVEANTHYEINCQDGYAVAASWTIAGVSA